MQYQFQKVKLRRIERKLDHTQRTSIQQIQQDQEIIPSKSNRFTSFSNYESHITRCKLPTAIDLGMNTSYE